MRERLLSIFIALLLAAARPSGLAAQPLFDAPYRWFPSHAPVHAVAASPRWHRTGAFAVATHTDEMSVEVFMAQPDGDLGSTAIIPVPSHPHGVAIADFDGDDCPDVAAGSYDPPGIVMIRGRCAGKFDAPVFFPCPTPVEGLAVDDIDADGHSDIVGWSSAGGTVMLNDQAVGFQAPIALPGSYPGTISVGRIDSDPYPDIAVATTIYYGRGDGTFGNARTFAGDAAWSSGLADLDGDGRLDIVYGVDGGYYDGTVRALTNDGNGSLVSPSSCPSTYVNTRAAPSVFTGGDVDGDGHRDAIVIGAARGGPVMTLLLGSGCGGFRASFKRDVQSFGPGVFADLDGDGRDDFLQPDGDGVSLFTASASGRFGPPSAGLGWDTDNGDMFAARVDDGPTLDLVVPDYQLETYDILYGAGSSGFGYAGDPHVGAIAIADLDLDGHNDIVTSSYYETRTALGDGRGTFTTLQDLGIGGIPGVLRAGGDPLPEVLVLKPDSLVVLRNGGGTLFEPLLAWPGGGNQLWVCDVNADGRDDAIIRNGSFLSARLGGPAGLGEPAVAATGIGVGIQFIDFDGDGLIDIFDPSGGAPQLRRGRGDGSFHPPAPLALPPASSYALADWNGDGLLDAAFLSGKVGVVFGTGGTSFSAPTWFGIGQRPSALVAGDLSGDGRPDLAVQGGLEETYGDVYGRIDFLFNTIPIGTPLGVGDAPISPSPAFALGVASPNPLRDGTRLHLSPGAAAHVAVRVLDIAGREVRVLLQGTARGGEQEVVWDGRDARGRRVPPGIYLVNARDERTSITRRVVVLH